VDDRDEILTFRSGRADCRPVRHPVLPSGPKGSRSV